MIQLHSTYKGFDIWVDQDTKSGKEIFVVLFGRKRHEYDTLGQARSAIALESVRRNLGKRYDRQR